MSGLILPEKGLIVPEHVAKQAARTTVSTADMLTFASRVFAVMRDAGLLLGGFMPKPPEGMAFIAVRMHPETREVTGQITATVSARHVNDTRGAWHQTAKELVDGMLARFAEADEAAAREQANSQTQDTGGEA